MGESFSELDEARGTGPITPTTTSARDPDLSFRRREKLGGDRRLDVLGGATT